MPVQLSVKVVNATLVRKGLEDLAAEIPKIARKEIYDALNSAKSELSKPAPKPKYPINWDSFIQMIAFFNTGGFGGGIPYVRRSVGGMAKSWRLLAKKIGWMLENTAQAAKYVFGDSKGGSQSNIHKGRWKLFRTVVEKYIKGLPKKIKDQITWYAKRKGF